MKSCEIHDVIVQEFSNGPGVRLVFTCEDKKMFIVIFHNNELFEQASKIKAGSTIELDFEQDGKYYKLNSIGDIVKENNSSISSSTSPFLNQQHSIQRQTSLKAAVDLITGIGKKYTDITVAAEDALRIANDFNNFLLDKQEDT